MQMDIKKRDSFIEMMNEVAKTYSCSINFKLQPHNINYMKVMIDDGPGFHEFYIDWREAKSQTEVATRIWANYFSIRRSVPVRVDKDGITISFADRMEIKDVIYNPPATIVFWNDGTKTVVKCCDQEKYDAEKGLAMAICEKAYGDKTSFHRVFKKWLPKEKVKKDVEPIYPFVPLGKKSFNMVHDLNDFLDYLIDKRTRMAKGEK